MWTDRQDVTNKRQLKWKSKSKVDLEELVVLPYDLFLKLSQKKERTLKTSVVQYSTGNSAYVLNKEVETLPK